MAKTFRPEEHIRRRADFNAVYQVGSRISGRWMTMFVKSNGGEHARLGVAATRKIGGAVIRNRAKRLTRELFRLYKPTTALDIVVIPHREFVDAPFADLARQFESLLTRGTRSAPPSDATSLSRQPRRPRGSRADSRV